MFHYLRIRKYSHGFVCDELNPKALKACLGMANQLVQFGYVPQYGQMVRKALKVYACSNATRTEFRFLIGHFEKFKRVLRMFDIDWAYVKCEEVGYDQPLPLNLSLAPKWKLRDYQEPIVKFLSRKTSLDFVPGTTWKSIKSLLPLQTGQGKGLCSMAASVEIGWRTVFLIRPMFHDKWVAEICDTYGIDEKQIRIIQGGSSLQKLLKEAVIEKKNQKIQNIILISNKTYQIWLKNYEKFGNAGLKKMGYPIGPGEFYQTLKVGLRIIDEAHMDFHLCCKADTYTHVPVSISLTATLFNKDPFLSQMYYDVYPSEDRYKAPELIKYADVFAVMYRFANPEKIRTTEFGSKNFSNNQVELSILKNRKTKEEYLKLIKSVVEMGFQKCTRAKKKLAIYAYNTDMINTIVEYLGKEYPQYSVKRYMSEDDYTSNLINSDIVVTTTGSAGTAQDISDLTNLICTIAISSEQLNVQLLGRLRQLKDNHQVEMHYLVPYNLEKPLNYHKEKIELFKPRVKSHTVLWTPHVIGYHCN